MLKTMFPRIERESSALGFGCMRLPTTADGRIDEAKAVEMIRRGIDRGVRYVDTAYPYHGGESERLVGKALKDGYRDRVLLATKLPCWAVNTHEDMMRILDEQLEKLQVDHVDFYLLHALGKDRYHKMKELDFMSFMEEALRQGKIRYPAFSFHDDYAAFHEILHDYDWTMCQVQMNILDDENQACVKGIQEAGRLGVGVVVMEPLRGGKLVDVPADAREAFSASGRGWSPAEWGLRWLWDQPEVTCVLSGMNSLGMVEENCRVAGEARVGELGEADFATLERAKEAINASMRVGCTGCGYCMPCPRGVDIPALFRCYNHMYTEGKNAGRSEYWQTVSLRKERAFARQCVGCGTCERHCPQGIAIREQIHIADRELRPLPWRIAGDVARAWAVR